MSSSSFPRYWQQAWDEAQPRLREWINSPSGSFSTVSERINRVGQLDAELLDTELTQLVQEPISKALTLLNPALQSKLEPELLLVIRSILHKFSLWDFGASYGAKLQDLRYVVPMTSTNAWKSRSGLPMHTLLAHAILTITFPYIHTRFRAYALSNGWPDAPSSDYRRKIWRLLSKMESTHSLLSLLNFVVFLSNGRYRTLADRLLSMRLTPSRHLTTQAVSYEFMNRQMVWHAFTEFLILILPMLNSRTFRRMFRQLKARTRNIHILPQKLLVKTSTLEERKQQRGPFFSLSADQCAICAENARFNLNPASTDMFRHDAPLLESTGTTETEISDVANDGPPRYPITIPYRASCGDIYCYTCIIERLVRSTDDGDNGWPCLRCGDVVSECSRLSALTDDGDSSSRTSYSLSDEEMLSFENDTSIDN